ncbi:MAG: DJ-1/PfpI family protein [Propionivibrio sp.]
MRPLDVLLFVFDGLSDWEAGHAVAAINNPRFQRIPGRYRVRTVAARPDVVQTMGGIRIVPDLTLAEINSAETAMLILPGGDVWESGGNTEAIATVRTFIAAGVPIAAICAATAALARGGLLDKRRHTSNAREYLAATGYHGLALYEEVPAVTDDDVITASGTAPVDFAQHIFRRLDLYPPAVLDAWYGLFKTGRRAYFDALMLAVSA